MGMTLKTAEKPKKLLEYSHGKGIKLRTEMLEITRKMAVVFMFARKSNRTYKRIRVKHRMDEESSAVYMLPVF